MEAEVSFDYVIIIIAVVTFTIGGVAKGAMGFGLPLIAIPMLTAFGSLPLARSIAVPPVVATNLWQIWKFRHHCNVAFLRRFLIVGSVGLVLGAVLLKNINNAFLEIALGCLVLSYLLRSTRSQSTMSPERTNILAPYMGGVAGVVHGTTGLSGMVGTPFFLATGIARPAFIFCNSMMFILFSSLHLPALAMVGLFDKSAFFIGVLAVVPAFGGLWLGNRFGENVKDTTFLKLVQATLAVAAILPIWNGLSKLFA